jgi:hypothetical protein
MKKSNLSIKNLKPKLKELFSNFFDNIKLHTDNILMLLFFAMIITWGFLFYKFAYEVSITNPEVSVTVIKIKKERLDKIADDVKKREIARENIDFSSIKNPFEDDIIKSEVETSGKGAVGVIPGKIEQVY